MRKMRKINWLPVDKWASFRFQRSKCKVGIIDISYERGRGLVQFLSGN